VALARVRAITLWSTLIVLILIAVVAVVIRIFTDWPNVAAGTVPPEDSFDRRYAMHPVLAYVHILPGVIYLVGAPLQLSSRFRQRRIALHRRIGRVVLPAGITAGVFAIVFGTLFPFGGLAEASATVVFGAYFVTALIIAFIAIKGGDVTRHRRWMIRALCDRTRNRNDPHLDRTVPGIRSSVVREQLRRRVLAVLRVARARGRGVSGEAPACAGTARRLTGRQRPRAGRFSVCDRGTPSSNSFSRSISALSSAPNSNATFVSHSQATSTMAPANVP
jgi:hypothetical protein